MTAIDRTSAWDALKAHHRTVAPLDMRDLFARDPERFQRFSLRLGDLLLDYSKNRVTAETMLLLRDLAQAAGLADWIERMFRGEAVNASENRPSLHVALRNRANTAILAGGKDVMPEVNRVLARMAEFVAAVRYGDRRGHTGLPFAAVVHIGIGGSSLGPRMAAAALSGSRVPGPEVRFIANVDPAAAARALDGLDPATTLFIVASKSFSTEETMANAAAARAWLVARLGEKAVARHFVAVSADRGAAARFGIDPANMFDVWDWVGGRYSMWSAVGLPIALAIGMEGFMEMLDGAHAMDVHFRTAPLERNLPVTLALIGIWYIDFFGAETQAVVPYAQALEAFPALVQQIDMESNGKSVGRGGGPLGFATGPIVWGGTGTDSQHAFHQLLHQGTRLTPVDFIGFVESAGTLGRQHDMLLANLMAQAEALLKGRPPADVRRELAAAGLSGAELERRLPHLVMPGNRPSNTILCRRLDPHTLGMLVALYEHKVFVQGVVWGIDSFDQWGVELGKQLARPIHDELAGGELGPHDSSTAGLIRHCRTLKEGRGS